MFSQRSRAGPIVVYSVSTLLSVYSSQCLLSVTRVYFSQEFIHGHNYCRWLHLAAMWRQSSGIDNNLQSMTHSDSGHRSSDVRPKMLNTDSSEIISFINSSSSFENTHVVDIGLLHYQLAYRPTHKQINKCSLALTHKQINIIVHFIKSGRLLVHQHRQRPEWWWHKVVCKLLSRLHNWLPVCMMYPLNSL